MVTWNHPKLESVETPNEGPRNVGSDQLWKQGSFSRISISGLGGIGNGKQPNGLKLITGKSMSARVN